MDDRQLLEAAAKAAGYDALAAMYGWDEISGGVLLDANDPPAIWNPLTDDGDALRLAVKLRMAVKFDGSCATAAVQRAGAPGVYECPQIVESSDHCAATRRAIVRAVAAIGSQG